MSRNVASYLRSSLPDHLYARLQDVTDDWSVPIFVRNPYNGEFECLHDRVLAADEDNELIDAVCMACELLTNAVDEDFSDDIAIETDSDPAGSVTFEYRFSTEDEEVFHAVRARLKDLAATDAGISVKFQKYPGGNLAIVTVTYAHTFDYQRKKDAIDWVLQIARRQTKDDPFKGSRI